MQVLDAVDDYDAWLDRWRSCGREPFAHPGYCRLFTQAGDRAVALIVGSKSEFALLPLIIRPVPTTLPGSTGLADAISPYGYGGPFLSGPLDLGEVLAQVEDWAAREQLCSAFIRLSLDLPLPAKIPVQRTSVAETAQNIVVGLDRSVDELWTNYQHKVRKNVKKALRSGCVVRRDDQFTDIGSFLAVYDSTMQRRNADQWYRFDHGFFAALAESLAGSYSVFSVLDDGGRTVSVELVLQSDAYLYSFLGGTLQEAFPMAPNDLLKHEVVRYGQQTGRRGFVLGGGYQRDDGIFRYKRAFDPQGVQAFRTARVIGAQRQYDSLVAAHGAVEVASFFPAYRAPLPAN